MISKESKYHLLSHSTEGLYIPIDWDGSPIFDSTV